MLKRCFLLLNALKTFIQFECSLRGARAARLLFVFGLMMAGALHAQSVNVVNSNTSLFVETDRAYQYLNVGLVPNISNYRAPAGGLVVNFSFGMNNGSYRMIPGCCNGNSTQSMRLSLVVNGTEYWAAISPSDDNTVSGDNVTMNGAYFQSGAGNWNMIGGRAYPSINVAVVLPSYVTSVSSLQFLFQNTYGNATPYGSDDAAVQVSSMYMAAPLPTLSLSKAANPTVLAVGASGQNYTLSINVATTATTAALSINDALPAGVTTSGPITSSNGSLSGCPAAGATSLSGCTLAAGVSGTVVITVPVNVSSVAGASLSNTASISGGGNPNCNGSGNCSASTTNAVIDAVNDSDSKAAGVSTTTNVSGNDKFPAGSSFTVTGGTCSSAGPITPATNATGVLSYTVPAGTASCTVIYKLCAPSPNTAVCDSATLTVATAAPTLLYTKALQGNRINNADQFTLDWINAGSGSGIAASTTTGTGSTVAAGTGTSGVVPICVGCGHFVSETMAPGSASSLSQYNVSVSCTNATPGGTNVSGITKLGDVIVPTYGDVISCVVTNSAKVPTITVTKALGGSRANAADQFTVQVLQGSTVVNATTASTTTGTGATVTAGSGTTGLTNLVAGSSYTLNEVLAAGSVSSLAQYTAKVSCSNALAGGTAVPTSLGGTFTPQTGDAINCTITNDQGLVTLTLTQLIISPFPVNMLPPYTFSYSINNGWPVQPQQLTTSTYNVPVSTPARTLAASNTSTTLSTSLPDARWFVSSFVCSDANAAITGNPTGTLVRVVGTSITIPAANVRAGSALKCTLTMGHKVP
jgi:hypothetical protein